MRLKADINYILAHQMGRDWAAFSTWFGIRGTLVRGQGFTTSLIPLLLCWWGIVSWDIGNNLMPAANAAEVSFTGQFQRANVFQGEPLFYVLELKNAGQHENLRFPPSKDYTFTLLTPTPSVRRFTSIFNGRRSDVNTLTWYFRIDTRKSGEITIAPVKILADGREYETQPLTAVVRVPEPQDVVRVEVSVDREAIYPLQPFQVDLKIWVKSLRGRLSASDPLAVRGERMLIAPWLNDQFHMSGLQGVSLEGVSESLGGGIRINEGRDTYDLEHSESKRRDDNGNEVSYWCYTCSRGMRAERPGIYRLPPAVVKGQFVVESRAGPNHYEHRNIYTVGNELVIEVKDVPTEGRPSSYTGAIGNFRWHGELAPVKARVGEPLTATFTVHGTGTIDSVQAPDLKSIPEVAEAFRVYDATIQTQNQQRSFTFALRPTKAGIKEFPPIPFTYFDVEQEKFVTLSSATIPLEILPAERSGSADVRGLFQRSGSTLEASDDGVFANITDPRRVRDERPHVEKWLRLLGALGVIYGLGVVGITWRQRWLMQPERRRRRAAPAQARQRLANARVQRADGDARAGADGLQGAFRGLVADLIQADPAALTWRDIREQLQNWNIPHDVLHSLGQLWDACDALRYGGASEASLKLDQDAEKCLEELIRSLRSARLTS